MIDLERVRAETPGVRNRTYLHNAGTGLLATPVLTAMKEYLDLEAAIGGYAAADQEADRLDAVYVSVARLINAAPDEIALTENATVAWQMAFYSLCFRPGDRILTAASEYGANVVAYLQVAKRTGAVVEVVPNDATGQLDVAALHEMIDERVKLIAVTWVPSNGGLTNPAAAIGAIAREHGIRYLLDACQAVGQMPVDVQALGCDFLSAAPRKFLRGPRGTGFLYVRRDLIPQLEPPMIDHFAATWAAPGCYTLRNDARRFETWENNYAARLGMGLAIDYALALGLKQIEVRARRLANRLRAGFAAIPGVICRDLGPDPSAIVSFTVHGVDACEVVRRALAQRITIGVSYPDSTCLDATTRALPVLVRASPHYYNTDAEVDRLLEFLTTLCGYGRHRTEAGISVKDDQA